jgi:polar amino acid transport system substrate-binding protein
MKHIRLISLLVVLGMILAACGSAAPAATATSVPTTPTATEPPAPTAVVAVDPSLLSQKGKLLICTDFPYPPQEFYDENGLPQGTDIDLGTELATRLGLKVEFVNSVFDSIIAAVAGGKCDIIISAMNITPDRQKQVSMIPYFKAGQSFVAAKGNPENINGPMDLCGKSAAAESGTTEAFYLAGEDVYKGKGLNDQCIAAGKQPINVVVTSKDTDALQQLSAGKVAVYSADTPVAAYYTVEHPDQFQLVGQVMEAALEGINMPCNQPGQPAVADCTGAPLSPLGVAVEAAFKSMVTDGTYLKILTKWNLQDSAVTP